MSKMQFYKVKCNWDIEGTNNYVNNYTIDKIDFEKYKNNWTVNFLFEQRILQTVKRVLQKYNLTPIELQTYLLYAQKLFKTQLKYKWKVDRERYVSIIKQEFSKYNLNPDILNEIDKIIIYNRYERPYEFKKAFVLGTSQLNKYYLL